MKLIVFTAGLACTLMALGCGPTVTYHFQVVDEATSEPLAGVMVTANVGGSPLGLRPLSHSETHCFGPTDANGLVDVGPILGGNGWFTDYIFLSKSGYQNLSGTAYSSDQLWSMASFKPGTPTADGGLEFKVPFAPQGRTVLPMRPQDGEGRGD